MPTAQKKVIVRRFTGNLLTGYLPLGAFVSQHAGGQVVNLLDLNGRVLSLALNDVKMISYVRDFNLTDNVNPERLTRRTFLARPRTEGLWVRMTFRTGDQLEGLAPTDLSLLDHLIEDGGLQVSPPDVRSNTQRIFVPRMAIIELQILAVITSTAKRKPLATDEPPSAQESLFSLNLPSNTRPN